LATQFTGRLSAAVVALGLSFGAPCLLPDAIAVATAESNDTAQPTEGASVSDGEAKTSPEPRNTRPSRPRVRSSADRTTSPDPATGTRSALHSSPDESGGTAHRDSSNRPARGIDMSASAAVDAGPPVTPAQPARDPDTLAPALPQQPTAPAAAVSISAPPAAEQLTANPQTAPEPAPEPVTAPPRAFAVISTPGVAAASSFSDSLAGLLGPLQAFFEGAALLVRRTLFNDAPTVNPLQLTGQGDGPITGTIGAVDPEDDPLSYKVSSDARYGTVSVTPAGDYTYTPGPDFTGTDSFVVTATDGGFHINLLNPFRPAGTSAAVSVARGAVTPVLRFQFSYGSGSQYWSPEARRALESAAARLTSYFVVSSPVTITYRVTGELSPFSSTLAEAGSDFAGTGTGFLQTVAQRKIQTGVDANGSAPDGSIRWNFGPSWGLGDSVTSGQYDFQSIAMHELLHTLGFLSYVRAAGANTGQTWTVFDSFLVNSAGSPVIGLDYVWKNAYNSNLTGGNAGLYFGGPNASAANNGRVPLHTPNPWAAGSSVSHLSDYVFTGSKDTLMNAVISRGPGPRKLSAVELGILRDIGYEMNPGPGTAAMMFVGVFLIRRRLD
jgi:hypothetical protein